ncbi:MAG: fumarylacetoacetate hydrolase family protein, partial [Hyphomicrobium sp.]|nr:fumarylacetoacetate hydrolase family protein [Hyphomicrobium sp.]
MRSSDWRERREPDIERHERGNGLRAGRVKGGDGIAEYVGRFVIAPVTRILDERARSECALHEDGIAVHLIDARRALRRRLSALLSDAGQAESVRPHLVPGAETRPHLPARIGDYTDFYVGIHHALNVGRLFRPDDPLLPNYKHVPIGYHGRASSVRPSGEAVRRPWGQSKAAQEATPVFEPCRRLDYELELGVWIGGENPLGAPVPIREAQTRIAGLCLLNDWSARDIQAWEYQPLGPFLSKSFLTTVSPWIITAEALEPYRVAQSPRPDGEPGPQPYLDDPEDQARGAFSLALEVRLSTAAMRAAGMAD